MLWDEPLVWSARAVGNGGRHNLVLQPLATCSISLAAAVRLSAGVKSESAGVVWEHQLMVGRNGKGRRAQFDPMPPVRKRFKAFATITADLRDLHVLSKCC